MKYLTQNFSRASDMYNLEDNQFALSLLCGTPHKYCKSLSQDHLKWDFQPVNHVKASTIKTCPIGEEQCKHQLLKWGERHNWMTSRACLTSSSQI